MKRRAIYLHILLVLLLSLLCGGMLVGCGETVAAPEVKNVSIAAVEGTTGTVGTPHRVTFEAPEGCEISYSVVLGEAPATVSDFRRDGDAFLFYKAGTYTVTVYAAKDGMLGSGAATLSVKAAGLGEVKLTAPSGYGKVGTKHALSCEGMSAAAKVSVEKDGAPTEDAAYSAAEGTIVFASAGTYTVVVEEGGEKKTATIEIVATAAPTLTLSFAESSVKEDGAAAFEAVAHFDAGDGEAERSFKALYRLDGTAEYAEAEEGSYTLLGELFLPHTAGEWKLVCTVKGTSGSTAEAEAEISCEAAALSLSPRGAERYRIRTGQAVEISYLADGATDKYNVSFDTHGNADVIAEAGTGTSVRITSSQPDWFTVTVVYTHKVFTTVQQRVNIDVYSVENLTYAPVWGEDPFGGMPSEVLTCMGHLLYVDATSHGGTPHTFLPEEAEFEVVKNSVKSREGSKDVQKDVRILFAGNNLSYPYLFVDDLDACKATGKFTVRMKLTDPRTGYAAVAEKEFTVTATGSEDAAAAKKISDYVKKYNAFFGADAMDLTGMPKDCRLNMVLTSGGIIMHRRGAEWSLNGGNADFAKMTFAEATENFRLDLKFTLLAPNPSSGAAWLGIGVRTVDKDGWAGFFDLKADGGKFVLAPAFDNGTLTELPAAGAELPEAKSGAVIELRLERRASGDAVEYAAYYKAAGEYRLYARWIGTKSTQAGNIGAPVMQLQFTHRNAGGCYAVENVSLLRFDV